MSFVILNAIHETKLTQICVTVTFHLLKVQTMGDNYTLSVNC